MQFPHFSVSSTERDGRILTAQIDVTKPEHPVQVEIQKRPNGQVLYVHVDGITVLRICQCTVEIVPEL